MFTSKDVMRLTGISRATLNNYIALGVVPRPAVGPAASPDERARRIGWFQDDVVERIREVQRLKAEGVPMAGIARRLGVEGRPASASPSPARTTERPAAAAPLLTVGDLPHPAYLVNPSFELEWCNDAARALFAVADSDAPLVRRNAFALLLAAPGLRASQDFRGLLAFHLAAAKIRLPRAALDDEALGGGASREMLRALFDGVAPLERRQVARLDGAVAADGGRWSLYASFFREGVLFAWTPADGEPAGLQEMLARRDHVINELLSRRPPFLTELAVLVADLQDAERLRAELPPEAFFALINDLWACAQPTLRRYYGVHGKHGGDGFAHYFLPQPDRHYALNAALCADELRRAMPELERRWRGRRGDELSLRLNIGIDEGREWFGAFQSPGRLEFAALGRTTQRAARLAGWARDGAVVASRRLLADLPAEARARLSWGVRRRDAGGRDWRQEEAFAAAGEGAAALMAAEIFDVSDDVAERGAPKP